MRNSNSLLLIVALVEKLWNIFAGTVAGVKLFFLEGYYTRLVNQGAELYRISDLYRQRWQTGGLEFVNRMSDDDKLRFLQKARELPLAIRLRILRDELLNRPVTTYRYE